MWKDANNAMRASVLLLAETPGRRRTAPTNLDPNAGYAINDATSGDVMRRAGLKPGNSYPQRESPMSLTPHPSTAGNAATELAAMIRQLTTLIQVDVLQEYATASEHNAMIRAYEALLEAHDGLISHA